MSFYTFTSSKTRKEFLWPQSSNLNKNKCLFFFRKRPLSRTFVRFRQELLRKISLNIFHLNTFAVCRKGRVCLLSLRRGPNIESINSKWPRVMSNFIDHFTSINSFFSTSPLVFGISPLFFLITHSKCIHIHNWGTLWSGRTLFVHLALFLHSVFYVCRADNLYAICRRFFERNGNCRKIFQF